LGLILETYKAEFIEFMVRSNVLKFGDFTTKSGRKTPFFINTGNYDSGEQLQKLGQFYAEALMSNMKDEFNVLFGPAYKGIPLAAATSMVLASQYARDIRFCFNRKEAKDHGEGGTMIGHKCVSGDKVVIIEDVTTAGTSVRESIPVFSGFDGVSVRGLVVSVDRQEKGQGSCSALQELRDEFGIKTFSIVTLDEIVNYLQGNKVDGKTIISNEIFQKIVEYRNVYGAGCQ
jgi:orotate phosphoribosyltransferase